MLKLCKLNVGPSNMTYDPPVSHIARNVLSKLPGDIDFNQPTIIFEGY